MLLGGLTVYPEGQEDQYECLYTPAVRRLRIRPRLQPSRDFLTALRWAMLGSRTPRWLGLHIARYIGIYPVFADSSRR